MLVFTNTIPCMFVRTATNTTKIAVNFEQTNEKYCNFSTYYPLQLNLIRFIESIVGFRLHSRLSNKCASFQFYWLCFAKTIYNMNLTPFGWNIGKGPIVLKSTKFPRNLKILTFRKKPILKFNFLNFDFFS